MVRYDSFAKNDLYYTTGIYWTDSDRRFVSWTAALSENTSAETNSNVESNLLTGSSDNRKHVRKYRKMNSRGANRVIKRI